MTITNHLRRIEELANHVTVYVDSQNYAEAHEALDGIESCCHASHSHIDNLQTVFNQAFKPESEET